jgi:hypothetical protein
MSMTEDELKYLILANHLEYYLGAALWHFSIEDVDSLLEGGSAIDAFIPQGLDLFELGKGWREITDHEGKSICRSVLTTGLTYNIPIMAPEVAIRLADIFWELIPSAKIFSNARFDSEVNRIEDATGLRKDGYFAIVALVLCNGTRRSLLIITFED